jgi:hypothetical protein
VRCTFADLASRVLINYFFAIEFLQRVRHPFDLIRCEIENKHFSCIQALPIFAYINATSPVFAKYAECDIFANKQAYACSYQGDQMEISPKIEPNPFFVKINIQILPQIKLVQKFGILL